MEILLVLLLLIKYQCSAGQGNEEEEYRPPVKKAKSIPKRVSGSSDKKLTLCVPKKTRFVPR
jgi:hypothetical protein